MRKTMKLLPFALLLAVSACAQYENKELLGRDHGDALNHNLSVQVIDPAPNLEGKEIPDMSGTRAALALERYNTGTVIVPEDIETSDTFGD